MVKKLGEYAKNGSQNSVFLQILFALLNIGVTAAFVLYIVRKILKTNICSHYCNVWSKSGNFEVAVKSKGDDDELSFLSESFNSMVTSIKTI